VLHMDDDSGALCVDGSSNVPSDGGGDDATASVTSAMDADSSPSMGNILALIDGGAIGAIYSGGSVAIGDDASVTGQDRRWQPRCRHLAHGQR
jgi:hypothetical protein